MSYTNFSTSTFAEILGNVASEMTTKTFTSKEGNTFNKHSFLLVYNLEEESKAVKIEISDAVLEKFPELKEKIQKGNFIKVEGKYTTNQYEGKTYETLQLQNYKLLKEKSLNNPSKQSQQKEKQTPDYEI